MFAPKNGEGYLYQGLFRGPAWHVSFSYCITVIDPPRGHLFGGGGTPRSLGVWEHQPPSSESAKSRGTLPGSLAEDSGKNPAQQLTIFKKSPVRFVKIPEKERPGNF